MNITEGKQMTLTGLEVLLSDRGRTCVGQMGEMLAFKLFEQSGYQVSSGSKRKGDLKVTDTTTGETFNVEVKTARKAKLRKRWQFILYKANKTDHRHSDYVLLLPVLDSGTVIPFLIPTSVLADQRQCIITGHPRTTNGKLAVYRQGSKLRFAQVQL